MPTKSRKVGSEMHGQGKMLKEDCFIYIILLNFVAC